MRKIYRRTVTCTNCSTEFRRDVLDSSTRCIRCRLSLSTYPIRPDVALGVPPINSGTISRDITISRDTTEDSRLRARLGGRGRSHHLVPASSSPWCETNANSDSSYVVADCIDCRREFVRGGEENLRCTGCLLGLDRAIARSVFAEPRLGDVKMREGGSE